MRYSIDNTLPALIHRVYPLFSFCHFALDKSEKVIPSALIYPPTSTSN